jgi:hypothetical protein
MRSFTSSELWQHFAAIFPQNLTFYLPNEKVKRYKGANWRFYKTLLHTPDKNFV